MTAQGTAPFTYRWLFNGANIAGATNATLNLSNVQISNAGAYSVVVSNDYGGTLSASANLVLQNVVAWGAGKTNTNFSPDYGQSIIPANLFGVIAISAGGYHSFGLAQQLEPSVRGEIIRILKRMCRELLTPASPPYLLKASCIVLPCLPTEPSLPGVAQVLDNDQRACFRDERVCDRRWLVSQSGTKDEWQRWSPAGAGKTLGSAPNFGPKHSADEFNQRCRNCGRRFSQPGVAHTMAP